MYTPTKDCSRENVRFQMQIDFFFVNATKMQIDFFLSTTHMFKKKKKNRRWIGSIFIAETLKIYIFSFQSPSPKNEFLDFLLYLLDWRIEFWTNIFAKRSETLLSIHTTLLESHPMQFGAVWKRTISKISDRVTCFLLFQIMKVELPDFCCPPLKHSFLASAYLAR